MEPFLDRRRLICTFPASTLFLPCLLRPNHEGARNNGGRINVTFTPVTGFGLVFDRDSILPWQPPAVNLEHKHKLIVFNDMFHYFVPFLLLFHLLPLGSLGESVILGHLDHDKYLGILISYLDPVLSSASHSDFVRCWHAKTDGSAASTFHSNCDGKGPTVTIIQSGDYIFGGYTDVSWYSSIIMSALAADIFQLNHFSPLVQSADEQKKTLRIR